MNTSSTVKRVLFATGSLAPYLLVLCLSPPPSARADTITLVQIGGPYEPVVAVGLTNTASRQGVQIGIAFDPAILQVEAVSPGDRIVAPLQLHTSELDDGRLLLLIFDETRTRSGLPPSSPETETIARITFRSSGSVFEPRVTTVSVYGALLADSLLNPISSVTWQDLAITNPAGVQDPLLAPRISQVDDGSVAVEWETAPALASQPLRVYRTETHDPNLTLITEQPIKGSGAHKVIDGSPVVMAGGMFSYHFIVGEPPTTHEVGILSIDTSSLPKHFAVYGARPNPFSRATKLRFDLPVRARALMNIYDVSGRLVCRLLDSELSPGRHMIYWPGTDGHGHVVASGLYFYRFSAPGFDASRRIVLIK